MKEVKSIILELIIKEVECQIKNAERGKLTSINESKSHKGAMASRYDTFKEEAQYLAGGHAARIVELGKTLRALKLIKETPPSISKGSCYAIIEAENITDGLKSKYFLLPAGGGNVYEVEGEKIKVLNVGAPMARIFIGVVTGDEVEINIQGRTKQFSVISVS